MAWDSTKEDKSAAQGTISSDNVPKYLRKALNLCLDKCWDGSYGLRCERIILLSAFTKHNEWQNFLASCPQETSMIASEIMKISVDLLDHSSTLPEDSCIVLELITWLLGTRSFLTLGWELHLRQEGPSPNNGSGTHGYVDVSTEGMVMRALTIVNTKLDDGNERVQLCALEALGEFLAFLSRDGSCEMELEAGETPASVEQGLSNEHTLVKKDKTIPLYSSNRWVTSFLCFFVRSFSSHSMLTSVLLTLPRSLRDRSLDIDTPNGLPTDSQSIYVFVSKTFPR